MRDSCTQQPSSRVIDRRSADALSHEGCLHNYIDSAVRKDTVPTDMEYYLNEMIFFCENTQNSS